VVLLAWMSFGMVLSIAMGAPGAFARHLGDARDVFRPLALPLVFDGTRRRRLGAVTVLTSAPEVGPGPIAVLAGIGIGWVHRVDPRACPGCEWRPTCEGRWDCRG
jgi:hypothetical protein